MSYVGRVAPNRKAVTMDGSTNAGDMSTIKRWPEPNAKANFKSAFASFVARRRLSSTRSDNSPSCRAGAISSSSSPTPATKKAPWCLPQIAASPNVGKPPRILSSRRSCSTACFTTPSSFKSKDHAICCANTPNSCPSIFAQRPPSHRQLNRQAPDREGARLKNDASPRRSERPIREFYFGTSEVISPGIDCGRGRGQTPFEPRSRRRGPHGRPHATHL